MYELEIWGEFLFGHQNNMGYQQRTVLANIVEGRFGYEKTHCSIPPCGIEKKGIDEFQLVQRVLAQLEDVYWRSAIVEYALPVNLVGKTKKARAEFLGIPPNKHHRRLGKLKDMVLAYRVSAG